MLAHIATGYMPLQIPFTEKGLQIGSLKGSLPRQGRDHYNLSVHVFCYAGFTTIL